ncbi:hypothetical protein GCM10027155_15620 [Acinetobacter apis]
MLVSVKLNTTIINRPTYKDLITVILYQNIVMAMIVTMCVKLVLKMRYNVVVSWYMAVFKFY